MTTRELIKWLRENLSGVYRPAAEAADRIEELIAVIQSLISNPSIDLGDQAYAVRESEGLGWEGPDVTAWSNAVTAAERIAKESNIGPQ